MTAEELDRMPDKQFQAICRLINDACARIVVTHIRPITAGAEKPDEWCIDCSRGGKLFGAPPMRYGSRERAEAFVAKLTAPGAVMHGAEVVWDESRL
nr:hypothetical protein [uncultured Rhodopila sp.]